MSLSKKVCIAISAVCLILLGVIFLSWHQKSVKESQMTAAEREKSNAEISSIYKRKVEEAKTATELEDSETKETTDGDKEEDKTEEATAADNQATEESKKESTEAKEDQSSSDIGVPAVGQGSASFQGAYQMLKAQQPIKLLVVGDSVAAGKAASQKETSWPELLADGLERRFGSQVTLTNKSMDQVSLFATYGQVMGAGGSGTPDDQTEYDLAIICCGKEEDDTDFGLGYEAVVRAIHRRYPACTIMTICQQNVEADSVMDQELSRISKAYNTALVDIRKTFGGQEDQLLDEAGYPNDAGHKMYAQSLFTAIYQRAEKGDDGQVPDRDPVIAGAATYDKCSYFPADQFKNVNNTTMEITTGQVSGILGIDYYAYNEDESVSLDIDGSSFSLPALNLAGEGQRVIRLVKTNFTANDKISVSFRDKDQADQFDGLLIVGP